MKSEAIDTALAAQVRNELAAAKKNHDEFLRSISQADIDAAVQAYDWLSPADAVRDFRRDVAERVQRAQRREAEAAERAQRESERIAQEKWQQHNPSFEALCDRYLSAINDSEPPAPKNYHGSTTAYSEEAQKARSGFHSTCRRNGDRTSRPSRIRDSGQRRHSTRARADELHQRGSAACDRRDGSVHSAGRED